VYATFATETLEPTRRKLRKETALPSVQQSKQLMTSRVLVKDLKLNDEPKWAEANVDNTLPSFTALNPEQELPTLDTPRIDRLLLQYVKSNRLGWRPHNCVARIEILLPNAT
jgi:hypothetical protein